MGNTNTNKRIKALFILGLVLALVLMSTVVAFADDPNPLSDDEQYVGETVTGYTMSYGPLLDFLAAYLNPFMAVISAVGVLYCVVLGVKYARAEEPQDREKAKKYIKNFLIGIGLVYVIFVCLKLSMPLFADLAYEETKNLDRERLQNVSEDGVDATGIDIYKHQEKDEDTIAQLRNRDSDYNTIDPTTTQKSGGGSSQMDPNSAEEAPNSDGGSGSYSNAGTVNNGGGGSGENGAGESNPEEALYAAAEKAISDFETAYDEYLTLDSGSTAYLKAYKGLKTKGNAVSDALEKLQSSVDNTDERFVSLVTRGNVCIQEYNELDTVDESEFE